MNSGSEPLKKYSRIRPPCTVNYFHIARLFPQDYLRHQPDNLRPFNIVAEATQFLSMLTSNITDKNIELVTQLLTTLNEICQVRTMSIRFA